MLAVGRSAAVTLNSAAQVRFALAPEHAPAPGSYGAVVPVTIRRAGRYRVALGSSAWVDMVRGGRALASVAHGHAPDCTGIRKMVDYDLTPGRYAIQFSGDATPTLAVMLARLPG
jgi:hypothetical protein